MLDLVLGNICSLGAMISDSFSGTRKTNRGVLLVQCISQLFYMASSFILKAYSLTAQNVVSIVRNIVAARGKTGKVWECVLILAPVALGIAVNNQGLLGYVPIIANLEYSVAMFAFDGKPTKLKYAFILNCVMYCVFNFIILNTITLNSIIIRENARLQIIIF